MFTEKTLRKRAKNIGYTVTRGCMRYTCYDGSIVRDEYGRPWGRGYMVMDDHGMYVWGSYNETFTYLWELEDVNRFLKEKYISLGLKW